MSPPILKQTDFLNQFLIWTDASSYALGAVFLQGEGADENPIKYARRLLSVAESNYSTMEHEALAVVRALSKFRGYKEDNSVTVASVHQILSGL